MINQFARIDKVKLVARYISYILSPAILLPLVLALSLRNQNINLESSSFTVLFLILFQIVIPLGDVYLHFQKREITSWDVPSLKDRVRFLFLTALCYLITVFYLFLLGEPSLSKLNFLIFLISFLTAIISKRWKISLHASAITFFALFVNIYLDKNVSWLYMLIIIVVWSRYYLGKHTLLQLLAGIVLTAVVCVIGFSFFGYS